MKVHARCATATVEYCTGLDVNRTRHGPRNEWSNGFGRDPKNCFWWACRSGHAHIVQYLASETQVDTSLAAWWMSTFDVVAGEADVEGAAESFVWPR